MRENPREGRDPRLTLDRILRLPELLRVIGVSSATIHRWMSEGSFPRPIRLGQNSVGWRASAVQEWIDSREEVAPVAEVRAERAVHGRQPQAVGAGDGKR